MSIEQLPKISPPFVCIFCESRKDFTSQEHIIPHSLGNELLVLEKGGFVTHVIIFLVHLNREFCTPLSWVLSDAEWELLVKKGNQLTQNYMEYLGLQNQKDYQIWFLLKLNGIKFQF